MTPTSKPIVVGIGELLWDCFENEKRIGGSPFNFANICHQLGVNAIPVSCVGNDALGQEIESRVSSIGMNGSWIKRHSNYSTGVVQVALDKDAKPSYEIAENAAWDHIEFDDRLEELAGRVDAAYFGSLCQRSPQSSEAIRRFLKAMLGDSLKLFDVNICWPYFNMDTFRASFDVASALKLSNDELPVISEGLELSGAVEERLERLRNEHSLDFIIYTMGGEGSLIVSLGGTVASKGESVEILDTVGAGNSFAAAFCVARLSGSSARFGGDFDNQVASYVCSQTGGCPKLPYSLDSLLTQPLTSS